MFDIIIVVHIQFKNIENIEEIENGKQQRTNNYEAKTGTEKIKKRRQKIREKWFEMKGLIGRSNIIKNKTKNI